ncbi:Alpha/Beta hydrolase protein [Bombardia bombarda]|uniref:Alpha/Beta hydrolase protein n=1 Tax=Bombardia bombarda TaxID=252184 RepID=A0AA39X0H8_9PEZI|nr:Alpha/Beta hydrolase protein [Bombardia bombarda]
MSSTLTSTTTSTSGTVEFKVPGLSTPCHTWYKIITANPKSPSPTTATTTTTTTPPTTPLIILHGGPGACHDYLLPLSDLAAPHCPIIFYDQLGNGLSTHLPSKFGDESFWTVSLFIHELDNLLTHLSLHTSNHPFSIYGHSWGGMLAAQWAATSPLSANLHKLIIASSLASMDVWRLGVTRLRHALPAPVQSVLDEAEETLDFTTPEYEAAVEVFYKRHLSLKRPWPAPEVQAALDWFAKDATTYGTMYGPSELYISGSLRDWTCVPLLGRIRAPTLLVNGSEDEAQDVAMQPFFDGIERVKWVTIDGAAHFTHVDQRERHMRVVGEFLGGV